jgi:DNA-binding response OmpR family regulator
MRTGGRFPGKNEKYLIIEVTPAVSGNYLLALEMRWPYVKIVSSSQGKQGIDMIVTEFPDMVILESGFAGYQRLRSIERIREFSKVPVLILTVRSDEADIVKGL